jgi:hypothetical protein
VLHLATRFVFDSLSCLTIFLTSSRYIRGSLPNPHPQVAILEPTNRRQNIPFLAYSNRLEHFLDPDYAGNLRRSADSRPYSRIVICRLAQDPHLIRYVRVRSLAAPLRHSGTAHSQLHRRYGLTRLPSPVTLYWGVMCPCLSNFGNSVRCSCCERGRWEPVRHWFVGFLDWRNCRDVGSGCGMSLDE